MTIEKNIIFMTLILALFTISVSGSLHAEENSYKKLVISNISDPVRTIIIKQLDALKNKNAEIAYSNLSDTMKGKYENAKEYLLNVKIEMRSLYYNKDHKFVKGWKFKDKEIRQLEITSDEGDTNTALFKLVKSENGKWVIESTILLYSDAQPI